MADYTPAFTYFIKSQDGKDLIWQILMGFKGKLVSELKYPLMEVMDLERRIERGSEMTVRRMLCDTSFVSSIFSGEFVSHQKRLTECSDREFNIFKTKVNSYVTTLMSTEPTGQLVQEFMTVKEKDFNERTKRMEESHQRLLSRHEAETKEMVSRKLQRLDSLDTSSRLSMCLHAVTFVGIGVVSYVVTCE